MHIMVNYYQRRQVVPLPYMMRSAGYYTPYVGFREVNDGRIRSHCGVFWCQHGEATFTINEKRFHMTSGDFLTYLPHASHVIEADTAGFQYYWLTFEGPLASQFLQAFQFPDEPVHAGQPPVELWNKAFKLYNDPSPDTVFTSMEIVSLILARAASGMQRTPARSSQQDAFVKYFKKIVHSHCQDSHFDLNAAAELMHCHRTTLLRNVQRYLKCQPGDIIQAARLSCAMQLLSSDEYSIAEVSSMSGFSSQSYFAKAFKKLTGQTPSDFRKKSH